MFTDRELEIIDEHVSEWTAENDGQPLSKQDLTNLFFQRAQEEEDYDPKLARELEAIALKYAEM